MTPVEQDFIDHLDKIAEHGVRGLVWVRNVQPEIAWIGHNLTTTVDLGGWHEPTEITKGPGGLFSSAIAEYTPPSLKVTGTITAYGDGTTSTGTLDFGLVQAIDGSGIEVSFDHQQPSPLHFAYGSWDKTFYHLESGIETLVLIARSH